MSQDPQQLPPIFGPIDVSAESSTTEPVQIPADPGNQLTAILQQISEKMDRQNELLEQLVQQEEPLDDPRSIELDRWRKAAHSCRFAAETLSRAQTEFLEQLTNEVCESDDALLDSNFMLGEFVDRYGPRLAHLNGVLQVLSQLSSPPSSE